MTRRSSGRERPIGRLVVAALVVVASASTGCTRPEGQLDLANGPAGARATATGTTPASTDPIAAAIDAGDFGSLKAVCGPAAPGVVNTATGSQGVTAEEIVVGTFSDPTNQARPGINQELFDTAEMFSAWCNDRGGVAGRKLKVVEHDAGLFNVAPKIAEACLTDFFLVGGGTVLDDAAVRPRLECLLPQISGYQVTDEARLADLQVQPQSVAADELQQGVFRFVDDRFPDSTDKVGFFTGNLAALQTTIDQYKQAAEGLGWKTAYDDQYNYVGESTWVPYAEDMKRSGIRGLAYAGEPENLALLLTALANVGAALDWVISSPNAYDAKLLEAGGKALDVVPVYSSISFAPFEYADRSPAMAQFLALFDKYLPKGKRRTLLAVNSMSAWLLFAEAAKACGAELTRRCVYENSRKPTAWDAGGLWNAADITDGVGGSPCFVTVHPTSKGFEVVPWNATKDDFNCDDVNILQLTGDYPPPMTLADVGKSIDDLR